MKLCTNKKSKLILLTVCIVCFLGLLIPVVCANATSANNTEENPNTENAINQNVSTEENTNEWIYIRFYVEGKLFEEQKTVKEQVAYRPAEPVTGDYMVEGWYENPEFTGDPWNFEGMLVYSDLNLYAKVKKATATFKALEHGTVDDSEQVGPFIHPAITTQIFSSKIIHDTHDGIFAMKDSTGKIDYETIKAEAKPGYIYAGSNIEGSFEWSHLPWDNNEFTATFEEVGNISGTVTDSTGTPLKNATASYFDTTHQVRYYATTNEYGKYSLDIPKGSAGEYIISAINHGFIKEDLTEEDTSQDIVRDAQLAETKNVYFVEKDGSRIAWDIVDLGSSVTKPADPTKKNAYFKAWYKDKEFTNLWDFNNDKIYEDTYIYARFSNNTIQINGKICDSESKEPISQAKISFVSNESNKIYGPVETDANGLFTLESIKGGIEGQLIIEKESYATKTIDIKDTLLDEDYNMEDIFLSKSTEPVVPGDNTGKTNVSASQAQTSDNNNLIIFGVCVVAGICGIVLLKRKLVK